MALPVFIIESREVHPLVHTTRFFPLECCRRNDRRDRQHVLQLPSCPVHEFTGKHVILPSFNGRDRLLEPDLFALDSNAAPHQTLEGVANIHKVHSFSRPGERLVVNRKRLQSVRDFRGRLGGPQARVGAVDQALKQAGKLGKIKLIGFDENDVTLQGIKDGFIIGTIVQDPYQYGYQSVKILKELLQGKTPESFIDIAPRKIVK